MTSFSSPPRHARPAPPAATCTPWMSRATAGTMRSNGGLMQMSLAQLFTILLASLGPASKPDQPQFQLKQGDQIVAIGDSITQAGGYLRNTDAVLAQQYPDLKLPKIINVGISGQKAEDLVKR